MEALVAHNFYRQSGGEDVVYAAEATLLRQHGHTVTSYERNNAHIQSGTATAFRAIWNPSSQSDIRKLLKTRSASIAHFHNTFPLISPSACSTASRQGAAVVQTLHNYRLICPGALLARNGAPCEDCITTGSLRPGLTHACYRGSRAATASVVTMLAIHRSAGTYQTSVDAYIALTDFARDKFIAGGLPADRIFVKPNFVTPDPHPGSGTGGYAFFAGRLSSEKGIETLAKTWRVLPDIPLQVAGDGPLKSIAWPKNATLLGHQPHEHVIERLREATVLVFPSTWYECMPMTILEAFACGTPVIASDLGSMAELVRHGHTGLLFRAGDSEDLATQVRYAFSHPEHMAQMRQNARREYEQKYTPERNYEQLMAIYSRAMENAQLRQRRAS